MAQNRGWGEFFTFTLENPKFTLLDPLWRDDLQFYVLHHKQLSSCLSVDICFMCDLTMDDLHIKNNNNKNKTQTTFVTTASCHIQSIRSLSTATSTLQNGTQLQNGAEHQHCTHFATYSGPRFQFTDWELGFFGVFWKNHRHSHVSWVSKFLEVFNNSCSVVLCQVELHLGGANCSRLYIRFKLHLLQIARCRSVNPGRTQGSCGNCLF